MAGRGACKEADNRFRTAPPVSRFSGQTIVDGYGFRWCASGAHIVEPGAGACKPCAARKRRQLRRSKR